MQKISCEKKKYSQVPNHPNSFRMIKPNMSGSFIIDNIL
jgi:hypothetical protein